MSRLPDLFGEPEMPEATARKVLDVGRRAWDHDLQIIPATPAQVANQDRATLKAALGLLMGREWVTAGEYVHPAQSGISGRTDVIHLLRSPDGQSVAEVFASPAGTGIFDSGSIAVVALTSVREDGTALVTVNIREHGSSSGPSVDRSLHSKRTAPELIVSNHARRLETERARGTGIRALATAQDAVDVCRHASSLQRAHRRAVGFVTPMELAAKDGDDDVIRALVAL